LKYISRRSDSDFQLCIANYSFYQKKQNLFFHSSVFIHMFLSQTTLILSKNFSSISSRKFDYFCPLVWRKNSEKILFSQLYTEKMECFFLTENFFFTENFIPTEIFSSVIFSVHKLGKTSFFTHILHFSFTVFYFRWLYFPPGFGSWGKTSTQVENSQEKKNGENSWRKLLFPHWEFFPHWKFCCFCSC
jgi:hypothetical protein